MGQNMNVCLTEKIPDLDFYQEIPDPGFFAPFCACFL